jgi:F-type H+-transporting ATPase subunit gamma
MPSTLETSQKINSLENMQKVTRAMNMIASIRLRRMVAHFEAMSLFEKSLCGLLRLATPVLAQEPHRLVAGYREVRTVHIVVLTADRGLCGSHNNRILRALDSLAAKVRTEGALVEVTCIGTKGNNYARRKGYRILNQAESGGQVRGSPTVDALADQIFRRFLEGQVQAVYLVYNKFVSKIRQEKQELRLLPLPALGEPPEGRPRGTPELDLPPEQLIEEGGRLVFQYFLSLAMAHSSLGEQAARMVAMENASKNAEDLRKFYVKVRNRVRQSNITSELTEIISGKEAMKR